MAMAAADGAMKLQCSYWTHDTVFLNWVKPNILIDAPYQLWYRVEQNELTKLALSPKDNYFTRKSLVLPGNCKLPGNSNSLVLHSGVNYTFILQAELEDGTTLKDSIFLKMADKPCTDTLKDLKEDQEVIKELYIIVDPKPDIYKAIAQEFGVTMKKVRFLESHKNPDERQMTVQVLDACIETCAGDEEKLRICNLLRVLHRNDANETVRILFDWHTGRPNGPGPCPVCTREQFLK